MLRGVGPPDEDRGVRVRRPVDDVQAVEHDVGELEHVDPPTAFHHMMKQ